MSAPERVTLEVGTTALVLTVLATVGDWHRLRAWLATGAANTFEFEGVEGVENPAAVLVRRHVVYATRVSS